MDKAIRILIVEDRATDAELVLHELRRAGFAPEWKRVETEGAYLDQLPGGYDLVLSDYQLPQFDGMRALELLNRSGLQVPFILLSGTIGEDTAVEAMRRGAADYLLKDRLSRLGSAVTHALEGTQMRRERLRAEEAARFTNAKLHQLLDQGPAVLYALSITDGTVTPSLVSENLNRLLGFTVAEALGAHWWRAQLHPEDRDRAVAGVAETIAKGKTCSEYRLRDKNGAYHWVEDNRQLVCDAAGAPTELVGVWVDITMRKQAEDSLRQSEERFRQLAATVTQGFWILDPIVRQMLYVSPAYEKIWGRPGAGQMSDPRDWLAAVSPEDRARVQAAMFAHPVSQPFDHVYCIHPPDGTVRWIRDRGFPVRNPAGQTYRVVGIAEDITEHRNLEEQFRQAQKMEAIGTLAGGIAHDFNNILAAISGYAELSQIILQENPEVRDYLSSLLQATRRATELVRQILTFSRQQPQERRSIQLKPIVAESLKLLRATLPATIEFDASLAADVPTVLADATQVHQIMMNLGTNAWHAMKDRTGRLRVTLDRRVIDETGVATDPRLRPGRYVHLSVGDTGCGMDAATLRRIFEPFFTTKPPGEGTGLGLSVVQGIMETHDGFLTVSSQPGEGTIFHLYFPAHTGAEVLTITEGEAPPRGQGQRLLLVDDEELLVRLGQKTLAMLGYEVEVATQPAAALAMVRADPDRFALVLTDLTMPGATGLQLASQLLQIRPGLPIILMTGYSPTLTPERIAALGIRQFLLKPASLHALASAVQAALR